MTDLPASRQPLWVVIVAVVCAGGVWTYAGRVLIPHQIADAAEHGTPRGNLSDLYPRWVGAKELLQHGRDPYAPEVTREIQIGFYGRPLDADRAGQSYQQGFYYPVYVAFCLAPTINLPFEVVRRGFYWVLLVLMVGTIPLWLRVLQWPVPLSMQVSIVVFTVGSLPVMQGLKLQQITLFVVPLLAVAMALLAADWPVPAGILLAVATIKPQLVWLLVLWLILWTLGDWRRRYRWGISFILSMAILCAASEWYLPHWIPRFWQAIREYHSYTGEMSALDELIRPPVSRVLEVVAFAVLMAICWKERHRAASDSGFAFMVSLVLAATNLLVPGYGPYNQVLLIPALLLLFKERVLIWQVNIVNRLLWWIAVGMLAWSWVAGTTLAVLSFILPAAMVERDWTIPFWTALQVPVGVAALMLVLASQRTFAASAKASTS